MTDWRDAAICRTDPERWFNRSARADAMHACRSHCPVVEQCLRDALACPPTDGVQGGVAFNCRSEPFPGWFYKPARTCPACTVAAPEGRTFDTGRCGTYAGYRRHLRRHEAACLPCRADAALRRQKFRQSRRGAAV